jgi:hypothetical protein
MRESTRHICDACLEEEFETWLHGRVHESMAQNKAWLETYKINDWPRWDYSLEDCTLTFSKDGEAKVICDIRAVGSVQGDSWEWSWGNKNLPDSCKGQMNDVRQFGEEKQWAKLTSLFLDSDDYVGWEMAAVTVHLLGGKAVYRCPDNETPGYFMYLVILSSQFAN